MEGKEELLGGQQSPLPLSYKFSEEDLGLPHVSGGLFQDSAPVCGNFLSSKIAQADFSSFSSLAQERYRQRRGDLASRFPLLFVPVSFSWAAFLFTRPVLVSQLERGELPWGLELWEPAGREALRGVCPGEHENLPAAFFA